MSIKATANGLAAFGPAWRPRLPRIPPAPLQQDLPPVQGCSRWFSCRSCRPTGSGSVGGPRARRRFATTPAASRNLSPASSGITPVQASVRKEGAGPTLSRSRRENFPESHAHHPRTTHSLPMPDLPLPPPLPFSPTSLPFQRHLYILSLALVEPSPDRSWAVFRALHPSLRRCLPDETYRALVARQRGCENKEVAWTRVKSLLVLGERCGVDYGEFGVEELGAVYMLGADESVRHPAMGEAAVEEEDGEGEGIGVGPRRASEVIGEGTAGGAIASGPTALDPEAERESDLLPSLWTALTTLSPNLGNIPLAVRRSWILYHISILERRRAVGAPFSDDFVRVQHELRQFIKGGGARWLTMELGRMLQLMSSGVNAKGHARVLRWMVWCMSRKVDVPQKYMASTMVKLWTFADREGMDGRKVLEDVVEDLLNGKMFTQAGKPEERMWRGDKVREVMRGVMHSKAEKAMELLRSGEMSYEEINRLGHNLALHGKGRKSKRAIHDWDGAVRLLAAALQMAPRKDAGVAAWPEPHPRKDVEALVGAISVSLTSGTQLYGSAEFTPDDLTPIILRFLTLVVDADILVTLPADIAVALFHLCLSTLPDAAAFPLARAIYPLARVVDPPWAWGKRSPYTWRCVFHHALAPESRDIEWASRLYADSLADGATVDPSSQLAMIHAISQLQPWDPSRSVLLERHIKDYLWDESLDRARLVVTVVDGLTSPKDSMAGCVSDAEIALGLAERLSPPGEPFSTFVTSRIIAQLSRSPTAAHRTKVREMLLDLPPSSEYTTATYDTVLSHLVELHRELSPDEMLVQVVSVYRELLARGVGASSRTVSVMVRGLLEAGHTDAALGVFGSCVEQDLLLMSSAAGQLMVRLGLAGRDAEAREVERRWREVQGRVSPGGWDRGVVGAGVLLDVRAGKEVDLREIEERTGWVGGESYLAFVESQRPPRDAGRGGGAVVREALVEQRASWEVGGVGAVGEGGDTAHGIERVGYRRKGDERGPMYGTGGMAPVF